MKKLLLTSILGIAVAAPAVAANYIDGNPLYRPDAGKFYSVTDLSTDTKFDAWGLGTELGYGINDDVSIFLRTGASTYKFEEGTTKWNNFALGASYRYFNEANWKADVYGSLGAIGTSSEWFSNSSNLYNWNIGTRAGYVESNWTLAGLFEYDYLNAGAFDWGVRGLKNYRLGVEGQYVFDANWNVVAKVTYEMPEWIDNFFTGKLGVNYNFDATKYLGVYVFQTLHDGEFADDTGLGLQFGIQF